MATLIADKYEAWKAEANARFDQLKANEEELNRIFAEIYNMVGEVPIEVEDKYVSVARIFDTAEEIPESFKGNKYVRTRRDEIVSLISYAVGCMLGRYSLDKDGLILANQGDTLNDYLAQVPDPTFTPDADNVLPITDDEYFDDDIVGNFVEWVRVTYGDETLEENLRYVADALGGKGCSIPARRTASRRLCTCTAIGPTCWRACAPTTCTSSRSATARRSRTWKRPRPPRPAPSARARPRR